MTEFHQHRYQYYLMMIPYTGVWIFQINLSQSSSSELLISPGMSFGISSSFTLFGAVLCQSKQEHSSVQVKLAFLHENAVFDILFYTYN